MDYIPNINLIDLDTSKQNEIIRIIRGCWQDAAVHLYIARAGLDDFMLSYGFSHSVIDYKYCCSKYFEFACKRGVTAQQLAGAFWYAHRKDVSYKILDIVTPKTPQVTQSMKVSELEAEIKQLKETIACRDKEIEDKTTLIAQLRNVVNGVAEIVL